MIVTENVKKGIEVKVMTKEKKVTISNIKREESYD
jgi:hypothetical protein